MLQPITAQELAQRVFEMFGGQPDYRYHSADTSCAGSETGPYSTVSVSVKLGDTMYVSGPILSTESQQDAIEQVLHDLYKKVFLRQKQAA